MAGGLSRVTIVAPRSRLDIALPSDVPLADMLPTLLDFAGGGTDDNGRRTGWGLSRLGGGELDSSSTPAQLEVRDGELLYLRPRGEEVPVTVFDDLVDALATGTHDRFGRWTPTTTKLAGLTAGVLALVAGAVALPFAGPPFPAVGLTGLALAVALLAGAVVAARALGDARTGTAFAVVATVYAGIGGLLVLAGDRPLGELTFAHIAIAATVAIVSATVASVGVPPAGPIFLSAGICAGAVLGTMGIAAMFDASPAAAATGTVVLAYALLPAMPMLAYRLVGLPVPKVPTEREHLRQDTETVDGVRVLDLARKADAYLAAMLSALAFISAGTAILVASIGVRGILLAAVLGVLPMVRSRWFTSRAQRLPLMLAGGIALVASAVGVFVIADQTTRLVGVFGATVAVAAVSIAFGLTGPRRQSSPAWGRLLDIVEILLTLAVAPLAVWVSGLLEWIRAVRG
jgi:type VII secretion integral membrane protein EccD